MKPGASIDSDPLESVKEALEKEVQAEFLKFIENLHTKLLVADVEKSLTKYAERYSKIVGDQSVIDEEF